MSETILYIDEIVSNPNIRGGRPVLRGTGLRVMDIIGALRSPDQLTPEEVAEHYHLSLGQVYSAIAYYHLHSEEIEAAFRADIESAERFFGVDLSEK